MLEAESIAIRNVTADDIHILQNISKNTFLETFGSDNNEEDMEQYLTEELSLNKLRTELTNADSIFYFATFKNNVIGYMKLNKGASQTEVKDGNAIEIERIYVLKAYHGRKVGQMLYDEAIKVATQFGVSYIWLGVWEKNPRAIRFYEKNGFAAFDKHIFRLGNDEQTDIMMKKELRQYNKQ